MRRPYIVASSDIGPNWREWTPNELIKALDHPIARMGFRADMNALEACDLCVLVMPCGRSAPLERGHAIVKGKPTAILLDDGEPELMYGMADFLTCELTTLCAWAKGIWEDALGLEGIPDADG